MQVCKYRYGKIGDPREPVSKIYSIGCGKFLQKPNKSPNGAKSKCSYVYFWGPILIGLKMGGRISLIIYFIVSACCLGPEATFKLDHLKLKASKASKQFIPCLFEVPPRKG